MTEGSPRAAPQQAGRYTLHAEIASGGMATVYLGQVLGAHGFSRVVAIKRMLPTLARDPGFRAMFLDEARLASRVQHPNVVPIVDVVDEAGEAMIVMEYVRGPSLSTLQKTAVEKGQRIPIPVAAAIACGMLAGLQAAHDARDRQGRSLGIVHRDVSPQNALVGVDGVVRIMDFGVAKADHRNVQTGEYQLKGKISYMAPEQLAGPVDRRTDVFATGLVLWGMLAGRRMFRGGEILDAMDEIVRCEVPPLGEFRDDVPPALEAALRHALAKRPDDRLPTAEAFAREIEEATPIASSRAVAAWVFELAGSAITERDTRIAEIERTMSGLSSTDAAPRSSGRPAREDLDSRAVTRDWLPSTDADAQPVTAVEGLGRTPTSVPVELATALTRVEPAALREVPTSYGFAPAPPSVPVAKGRTNKGGPLAWVALASGALALGAVGAFALGWPTLRAAAPNAAAPSAAAPQPSVVALATADASAPGPAPAAGSSATAAPVASASAALPTATAGPRATTQPGVPRPTADHGATAKTAAPTAATATAGSRGPYYPPSPFPR